MICHAGNHAEIDRATAGDDDMIIRHLTHLAVVAFVLDVTVIEIDSLHRLGSTAHVRQHLPERCSSSFGIDGSARNLRQQGMKHHVIFAIEDRDLIFVARETFAQGFCTLDAGKSAADDHYSYDAILFSCKHLFCSCDSWYLDFSRNFLYLLKNEIEMNCTARTSHKQINH